MNEFGSDWNNYGVREIKKEKDEIKNDNNDLETNQEIEVSLNEKWNPNEKIEEKLKEIDQNDPNQESKIDIPRGIHQEDSMEFKKEEIIEVILNEDNANMFNFNEYLRDNLYKNDQMELSEKSKIIKLTQIENLTEVEKLELQTILNKFPAKELEDYKNKDIDDNRMFEDGFDEGLDDSKEVDSEFKENDTNKDFLEDLEDTLEEQNRIHKEFAEWIEDGTNNHEMGNKFEESLKDDKIVEIRGKEESLDFDDLSWLKDYDKNSENNEIDDLDWLKDFEVNLDDENFNKEFDNVNDNFRNDNLENSDISQDLSDNITEEKAIDGKERIKEYIKNLEWVEEFPDWTIIDRRTGNPINLDPTQDCSKKNPLYKSEKWLNRIYNDDRLDLSDRKIGELYNLSHKTIGNWRKKLDIPTKAEIGRYINDKGYVELYMPKDYRHPELTQNSSGRIRRKEHDVVMENYLKENPESDISKKYLIDGKYLKSECEVHHINHIPNDNRLENLWLYETKSEHSGAQRSLNDCFSCLYKLSQIQFNEGKYNVNYKFDYKTLDLSEIKEIIKPAEFKGDMSIKEIKHQIKTLDWDHVPNDWNVWKNSNQYGQVSMTVDPYKDCSKENPLYRNKFWMETIVREKQYNLTDPRLAKVCGISESTAYKWRWNHHKIPTYYERWGNIRTIKRSESAGDRIWRKIPNDYKNPFAIKLSRQNIMLEHRYVIENYLAKHLELGISQNSLLDGKFLKSEYKVHHINLVTLDNRLKNLWVCEEHKGHNSVHASLLDTVSPLIQSGLLSFKKGKYYLNYEE